MQAHRSFSWKSIWHFAVPILSCVVIMLPRLISPDFNIEDDGITLMRSQEIISGKQWLNLRMDPGRFRPMYWDGLALIYLVGKTNPLWYYLSNTLLLLLTTAGLVYLVQARGGSRLQAMATGLLFALAGPVIESYYTISKPEAAQVFWLVACLALVQTISDKSGWVKRAGFWLAAGAALLSMLFKEISAASFLVGAVFLAYVGVFHRDRKSELRLATIYFLTNLVAVLAYLVLISSAGYLGNANGGGFTNNYTLMPTFMLFMMNYWTGWLIRDFAAVLVCFLLLLTVRLFRNDNSGSMLLVLGCIWMAVWMGIYLPWDRSLEYYLLPFAVGYSIFCGVILGKVIGGFSAIGKWQKLWTAILLAVFSLYFGTTVFNNYTNARLQIVADRQSTLLMQYLARSIPPSGSVVVNWNAEATFPIHFKALLATAGKRPDISLIPFSYQMTASGSAERSTYLLLTPVTENKPLFAVRSVENTTGASLQGFLPRDAQPVYETKGHFRIVAVNLSRLLCTLLEELPYSTIYCRQSIGIIDTRVYSTGWEIYRYQSALEQTALPTVFTAAGIWQWQYPDGDVDEVSFGQWGDLPLSADWDGNGWTDLAVFRPTTSTWYVDLNWDGEADLEFTLAGMQSQDIPLAGDWDCDGQDSPGYFRPSDQTWHFWNGISIFQEDLPVLFGDEVNAIPLVGDWNGDGCDTIGVYRPDMGEVNLENQMTAHFDGIDFYAPQNAIPVPGDWGGQGLETLTFFDNGEWLRMFANCECPPSNSAEIIIFGNAPDLPISGEWHRP